MKRPRHSGAWEITIGRSVARDDDRLLALRPFDGEAHLAVGQSEQRVIATHAHIRTGMKPGSALSDDDRAGRDCLTAKDLDAEHLRLRVPAVPRRTATLFLCHFVLLAGCGSAVDSADLDLGETLPMALSLLIVLAALHLEDANLVVATVRHHRRNDARS